MTEFQTSIRKWEPNPQDIIDAVIVNQSSFNRNVVNSAEQLNLVFGKQNKQKHLRKLLWVRIISGSVAVSEHPRLCGKLYETTPQRCQFHFDLRQKVVIFGLKVSHWRNTRQYSELTNIKGILNTPQAEQLYQRFVHALS